MPRYVDGSAGWRFFFFSLTLSCFVGLAFRLYFSPDRIRDWVAETLGHQSAHQSFRFREAELRLARGAMPDFAVVLSDVEIRPAPECHKEPSITISKLSVPFRLTSVFSGQVAVGVVTAEGLAVDLDGPKVRCPAASARRGSAPGRSPASTSSAPTPSSVSADPTARPWWTPDQLSRLQKVVKGFEFSRVELQFENKTKKVYLESLAAYSKPGDDFVRVNTDLRIPPELAYGEKVPPLSIEAEARADKADVVVRAILSEGALESRATLKPAANEALEMDARVTVANVPLSTLVPLLNKAGIVEASFRPKFLWLDCYAAIRGRFQGLFQENSLTFSECALKGEGGSLRLASAVRQPNGTWESFTVHFDDVRVAKLMETIGFKGLDGFATDYGRINGQVDVLEADHARFHGVLKDMLVRFSSGRNGGVSQRINRLDLKAELTKSEITGSFDRIELEGGHFDGAVQVQMARDAADGSILARIQELRLSDTIQTLVLGGRLKSLTGSAEARWSSRRLRLVTANLNLQNLESETLKFAQAQLEIAHPVSTEAGAGNLGSRPHPEQWLGLNLKIPNLEVNQQSPLFAGTRPIFFEHRFNQEWVDLRNVSVRMAVDNTGTLTWERTLATLENGRIGLTSGGSFNYLREIDGWVSVDYPRVKKLRWSLSGHLDAPNVTATSKTLAEFTRKNSRIDSVLLGLPRRAPGNQ